VSLLEYSIGLGIVSDFLKDTGAWFAKWNCLWRRFQIG